VRNIRQFGLADNRTPVVQPVVSPYTAFKHLTSLAQLAHWEGLRGTYTSSQLLSWVNPHLKELMILQNVL
jgi:hypothetical protein